ncbi:MAG: hypothetical protein GOV02_04000 [Candidatus Aenigmarchaeota archaeon]|nr:hypothetical protein [Candidatus Aenigmarchaeota archaeon]
MEVVQKNGETVYSDFNVEVNGKTYQENEDEEDELLKQLYGEMLQVHKKWKKKRVR